MTESVKIDEVEKWAKAISINPRKIVKVKPEDKAAEAEKKTIAEEAENQKVSANFLVFSQIHIVD